VKVEDFDSEPETPAKKYGLPNSFFTRVVQASRVAPESLRRRSEDSGVLAPGSRRLQSLQTGHSGPKRPETPGLVDPNS
jgi:hypothetical protein